MLSEAHIKGIQARGISEATALRTGIYSGRRLQDGSVVPDPVLGEILCMPFIEGEVELGCKYRERRNGEKRFWQRAGGTKTFFNADVLLDEAMFELLVSGEEALVITEGEFDALTAIECGFDATVSVPDGAPPARDKHGRLIPIPDTADDIDPEDDAKFEFIARHIDRLLQVRFVILAVDADEPGERLRKEIIRRIGAARCLWVRYPDEPVVPVEGVRLRPCKDLNEVLVHFGKKAVVDLLNAAKPVPVKGLYKLSDYPEEGEVQTVSTGMPSLDSLIRPYLGAFMVVTGVPGMGKSTWVDQLCVNLARNQKWPVILCSPEMPTVPYTANILRTMYLRKPRGEWGRGDRAKADEFIENYFSFIDQSVGDDEDDLDIDYVIEKARTAVERDGAKVLVIDPWNELEHKRKAGVSLTEHTGDAIRKLKKFARTFHVLVIVVAHPKKLESGSVPSLYDIADSAHWANKPDLAVIVHSDNPANTARDIIVKKVRFSTAGRRGEKMMEFDRRLEMFLDVQMADDPGVSRS